MPPPPPARRRPTGVATPAASGPNRARRPTGQVPRVSAPPPPSQRLVCSAGPCAGQEFALEGDEVVIGRSADNAIAIPDTSVSRKHVLLRRTPEGWAASDMGSGNGTLVNSSSIAEETVLTNGDVIAMGDTELQYVDEAAAARPVRRNSTGVELGGAGRRPVVRSSRLRNQEDPEKSAKKKKLFIRGGAIAVVLMAGFVGYKIIETKRKEAASRNEAIVSRTMEQLRAMNQEARNLIRAGKWAEAKALLEQVQAANPNFGGGTVQQYIAKTEQEIPNEQHLLKAAELVKLGQLTETQKELALVSADTLQVDRREKVRSDLEAKIETRLRDAAELVPASSDLAKMKELLAIANDVLGAKEEHRDASQFKETAEKAIYAIEHPPKAIVAPKTPWVAAQAQFANGDQAGALAMANACAGSFKPCKQLMGQIQTFNEKNRKLESLGPADLLSLLELDRKITGGPPSTLSKPIATRVVTAFYLKATSAKAKGDWGQAVEYAKRVLSADPSHPGAQAIVAEARGQSRELYLRGYQLKDGSPDEAITFFKQVMQMTVKGDEFHEKAKLQLDKLKQ